MHACEGCCDGLELSVMHALAGFLVSTIFGVYSPVDLACNALSGSDYYSVDVSSSSSRSTVQQERFI